MKLLNEEMFIPPLENFNTIRINSSFGKKRSTGTHKGVDFNVTSGTNVFAPAKGFISYSGNDGGYCGGRVDITHSNGYKTRYCHLKTFNVSKGSSVLAGSLIGTSGGGNNDPNKGRSTGAHLHFALLKDNTPIDPMPFIDKDSRAKYIKDSPSNTSSTNNAVKSSDFAKDATRKTSDFDITTDSPKSNFDITTDSPKSNFDITTDNPKSNFDIKNEQLVNQINRIKILLK
jgi:hypothetical protein